MRFLEENVLFGVISILLVIGLIYLFTSHRIQITVSLVSKNAPTTQIIAASPIPPTQQQSLFAPQTAPTLASENSLTSQKFLKGEVVNLFNPGQTPRLSFYGTAMGRIDYMKKHVILSKGPGTASQGLAINFNKPLNLSNGYIHLYVSPIKGGGRVRLLFRDKNFRSTAKQDKKVYLPLDEATGIQSLVIHTNEISTKISWKAISQIRVDIQPNNEEAFIVSVKDLKFSKGL